MAVIILIAISLLGVVTFVLWQTVMKVEPQAGGETKGEALPVDKMLELTVETPEITTNLYDDSFIIVKFKLQTNDKKAKTELEKRMFQVENIVLKTLASLKPEDLKGADGYYALEAHIMNEINSLLQEGRVVEVYTVKMLLE